MEYNITFEDVVEQKRVLASNTCEKMLQTEPPLWDLK